ncbi:hypothetical protein BL243_22385 [Ralstonia solanacearum]|nr:hypothetical protein BL243_22385 [Ralstonia solanacearum]
MAPYIRSTESLRYPDCSDQDVVDERVIIDAAIDDTDQGRSGVKLVQSGNSVKVERQGLRSAHVGLWWEVNARDHVDAQQCPDDRTIDAHPQHRDRRADVAVKYFASTSDDVRANLVQFSLAQIASAEIPQLEVKRIPLTCNEIRFVLEPLFPQLCSDPVARLHAPDRFDIGNKRCISRIILPCWCAKRVGVQPLPEITQFVVVGEKNKRTIRIRRKNRESESLPSVFL